jgi:hypothetical protein
MQITNELNGAYVRRSAIFFLKMRQILEQCMTIFLDWMRVRRSCGLVLYMHYWKAKGEEIFDYSS